jgi:hypothetical protein
MNERGLKDGSSHPIDISSGSPPAITPPSPSTSSPHEKDKLKEVVIVEEGQTLSFLAKKHYRIANTTLVALILDANSEISNANLILVNQIVHLPKITKELLVIQSMDRTYKIHVGTFQDPDPIRLYRSEPVLKGRTLEVLPRKVSPKDTWYQVMVGPFIHRDECLKVIDQLKEKGLLPAL